jgi:membrane associated rhomboid family serine protease
MIPLRDDNPAHTTPVVTRALILMNVLVFVFELALGPQRGAFVVSWAVIPARIMAVFGGIEPSTSLATTLSFMFLHAGWLHLLGNMWYLWIFGDNVEDRMGHVGFLAFYLASGVASAVMQIAINPGSPIPTVGASGAIAGVLGSYLVLFPRAKVVTLVPIVFFLQIVALPAVLVLGLWFVFQFFSGAFALGGAGGGVAWWAHIGGFLFGMAVTLALRGERTSRAWVDES